MSDAIRAAAQEIATLINARPQSPRVDELEAIIANVMTCQDTSIHVRTPAPAVLEWHRHDLADAKLWEASSVSDAEADAILERYAARARAAYKRPVQSWDDVAELGAICLHYNFSADDPADRKYMDCLLARTCNIGMDEQSLAHLLKAICTMGGFERHERPTAPIASVIGQDAAGSVVAARILQGQGATP